MEKVSPAVGVSPAHKLDLHHRIALVGFDDVLLADLLKPGITVIAQDPSAMGRKAAEQLFRRIAWGSGEIVP